MLSSQLEPPVTKMAFGLSGACTSLGVLHLCRGVAKALAAKTGLYLLIPSDEGSLGRYGIRAIAPTQQCGLKEEVSAFEEYFYHIMAQRGSGEYALRWLLAPYAWAHNPLDKQLHELKVGKGQLCAGLCTWPHPEPLAACQVPGAAVRVRPASFVWLKPVHVGMLLSRVHAAHPASGCVCARKWLTSRMGATRSVQH